VGSHLPVLSDLLAALMLAVAVYCLGRFLVSFASGRTTQRDADAVHTVMGVSMAGMLTPSLAAVPDGLWVLVFGASILWFGWRVVRDSDAQAVGRRAIGQHLPHLLMSAAMVYMLIVAEWTGAMNGRGATAFGMGAAGMSAIRWPLLIVVITILLLGDGVLTFGLNLRQLVPQRAQAGLALAQVGGGEAGNGGLEGTSVRDDAVRAEEVRAYSAPTARLLAPRSGMVCQLVMSLVMGYMLLSLL
jgi:hypothetical protein